MWSVGVNFRKAEGNADEDGRRLSPGAVKAQSTGSLFGEIVLTKMSKVVQNNENRTFSRRILEVESFVSTDVILYLLVMLVTGGIVLTRQVNFEYPQPPCFL